MLRTAWICLASLAGASLPECAEDNLTLYFTPCKDNKRSGKLQNTNKCSVLLPAGM